MQLSGRMCWALKTRLTKFICRRKHIERHLVKSLTADEEKAHSSSTEIPIIQTPLEIIKSRHIQTKDKWL